MKKSLPYFWLGCLFFFLFLFSGEVQAETYLGENVSSEFRGVWIDVRSIPPSREGVKALVDKLSDVGFNAVLVEVFYRGETIYPSSFLASLGLKEQMEAFSGWDPLLVLTDLAHQKGMEVHAWFDVAYLGLNGPDQILEKYPAWSIYTREGKNFYRQGENAFFFLCPGHPGVLDFFQNLLGEMASKYEIDGIHLDYLRFPDPALADVCYDSIHRKEFFELEGEDPLNLDPLVDQELYRKWNDYRANLITDFLSSLSGYLRSFYPKIELSVAVWPRGFPLGLNPNYLQDWPRWAKENLVDVLVPMVYTSRVSELKGLLVWVKYFLEEETAFWAGLQAYNLSSPEELVSQIKASRQFGPEGIVIFALPYLDDSYLAALKDYFSIPLPSKEAAFSFEFPEEKREIEANFVYQPILIDGVLEEDVWKKADWQGDFWLITGEGKATEWTEIAVAYDREKLYLAFRAHFKDLNQVRLSVFGRDGPVFYDDSLEVFLDPQSTQSFYYHLAWNTGEAVYDSYLPWKGVAWNGEWELSSSWEDNLWLGEVAIPFSSLGVPPPEAGDVWRVNFNRNSIALGEFSSWSFTPGTYHAPSFFGELKFSK